MPGLEQQVPRHVEDQVPAARLDAHLPRVDLRLEAPLEVAKEHRPRLGRGLRSAELIETSPGVVERLRQRAALRQDLVHVLAEALELGAELLVDGRRLVELRLQVVLRGGEVTELRVTRLGYGLGRDQALRQVLHLRGVVLLLGVAVRPGLRGVGHGPVVLGPGHEA